MIRLYSVVAVGVLAFAAGWTANDWRLQGKIDQLHATWNEAYANQTQATLEKERAINELNTHIEVNNAAQAKAIDDAHDANARLADTVKRMQQSASRGIRTVSKNDCTCECAVSPATGEFSGASIDLLVELAREADDAARYANVCHEWAVTIGD